jgi:hypothetical protein
MEPESHKIVALFNTRALLAVNPVSSFKNRSYMLHMNDTTHSSPHSNNKNNLTITIRELRGVNACEENDTVARVPLHAHTRNM